MELQEFKNKLIPVSPRLLRFAGRMLANQEDARDVLQDVYLKLWLMREKLDSYRSLEALSMTMIKNACIDQLRKRKPFFQHNEAIEDEFSESGDVEELFTSNESYTSVLEMVNKLPEQQKAIIHLKDIEGYSTEEVMEIMGITANTLRVNLSRARMKLRELIVEKNTVRWNANN
jgi:RNA polymerase sigma-70 factor (ECF subfamily)